MSSELSSRTRTTKRLVFAFVLTTLAVGAYWWPPSYNDVQIVSSWWVFALISVVGAAIFSQGKLSQSMLVGVAVAGGALLAVLIRVIFDLVADSTSHNLWPIEMVLAGVFIVPSAFLGAAIGMVLRKSFARG